MNWLKLVPCGIFLGVGPTVEFDAGWPDWLVALLQVLVLVLSVAVVWRWRRQRLRALVEGERDA